MENTKTSQHHCYKSVDDLIYEPSPYQAPMWDVASPHDYDSLIGSAWPMCSSSRRQGAAPHCNCSPGVVTTWAPQCTQVPWWEATTSLSPSKFKYPRGTTQHGHAQHNMAWYTSGEKKTEIFWWCSWEDFQNYCCCMKRKKQFFFSLFLSGVSSIYSRGQCDLPETLRSPFLFE